MNKLHKFLKKYFVPHKENEYKPHFLRHESVLLFLSLIIIVELGFFAQIFIVFDKTNFLAAVLPGALTALTNQERAQNNVPPLTENSQLDEAAQMKAQDMATNGYFAHTSPDGKTPWYWFNLVGYKYSYAGENLAVNFFESADVAQAWMNSPTHRKNIVKPNYTDIGIGVASGMYQGRNTVFVAQLFGTPLTIAPIEVPEQIPPTSSAPPMPSPVKQTIPATSGQVAVTVPTIPVPTPVAVKVLGDEVNTAPTVPQVTSATPNNSLVSSVKSFIEKLLSSPRQMVDYIYGGIALLIIITLLLMLFIKSEVRHPMIIARGFALIAVIIVLSFINLRVLNIKTEVPAGNLGANAIEALP